VLLRWRQLLRRGRGEEGAAAVEFAILLLPLLLIIGGVVDFGHAYYIKHLITSASREGARYGSQYHLNSSTMVPYIPNALTPTISNYVKLPAPTGLNYDSLLGSDANLTVTPGGAGYTSNTAGSVLTVTVTADKHWFFLGGLLGFSNPTTLTATTAMALER
jgi:Flp pilus assembly protein TadG